jgi:hypothetical protein
LFLGTGTGEGYAQCRPAIKIDGGLTVADPNDASGLQFPIWLKEGQTLAVGSSVSSISVIEFAEVDNALQYSSVLNITSASPVTVPADHVWKIEGVVKQTNTSNYRTVTFSFPGTYSWSVPACAEQICVEAWGGGGGGSANAGTNQQGSGGGGGGGGYGAQCFAVTPGSSISITVGAGGNGGASGGNTVVGSLLTANGGSPGITGSTGGTGGNGGSSTAASTAVGGTGFPGAFGCAIAGGRGGAGGNGGAGGAGGSGGATGAAGTAPGGGGGGASGGNCSGGWTGGRGGDGRVIISW